MKKDTILVIGAKGQIGVELTHSLRKLYGHSNVVAADLGPVAPGLEGGPYEELDVLEREELGRVITRHDISQIYLLAAKLSAVAERLPLEAWNVNMLGLLNVLEAAREKGIGRVFWPSSIAVFGPDAPKWNCPQNGPLNPATVYGISKVAGECWCRYYWDKYAVDVRSLRYPGLISYQSKPGGGTTDYAVEIFHEALHSGSYTCYLRENTILPMIPWRQPTGNGNTPMAFPRPCGICSAICQPGQTFSREGYAILRQHFDNQTDQRSVGRRTIGHHT